MQSVFFLSIDTETKQPVGALRIIEDGPSGLKTINDIAEDKKEKGASGNYKNDVLEVYSMTDFHKSWDIGTVAVAEGNPGGSPLLYRAMYVASQRAGVEHFFSIIDQKAYQWMELFGFPFETLHETDWAPYMDSPNSLPVHGDAPVFEAAVQQQEAAIRTGREQQMALKIESDPDLEKRVERLARLSTRIGEQAVGKSRIPFQKAFDLLGGATEDTPLQF
jgi:hypothetical protein